jgi:hypothetical protein
MRSAIVYFAFSVVAGTYAFYRASEAIWGAPASPLAYLCFFGSVLLLIAAIVAPFSQRPAAKLAIAGCIAAACLFLPLFVVNILMPFTTMQTLRDFAHWKEFVPLIGMLGGPILLAAATACAVSTIRRSSASE